MADLTTFSYAGHSDWVVPDKNTLAGQYSQKSHFSGIPLYNRRFWSSTYTGYTDYAWYMEISNGDMKSFPDASNYIVWPVRSGQ